MVRMLWDPVRELEEVIKRQGAVASGGRAAEARSHESMTRADWTPAIDIIETADEFVVKAELTEVGRENIEISVNNGVLEIRGERPFDGDRDGIRYHRVERPYGTFARSFALPENVEEEEIRAEYREGMLYLHLPRHRERASRAIRIPVD